MLKLEIMVFNIIIDKREISVIRNQKQGLNKESNKYAERFMATQTDNRNQSKIKSPLFFRFLIIKNSFSRIIFTYYTIPLFIIFRTMIKRK